MHDLSAAADFDCSQFDRQGHSRGRFHPQADEALGGGTHREAVARDQALGIFAQNLDRGERVR
jgi:hypothetical protein